MFFSLPIKREHDEKLQRSQTRLENVAINTNKRHLKVHKKTRLSMVKCKNFTSLCRRIGVARMNLEPSREMYKEA